MRISAYFPDVSSNFYFEYYTDFQDRELKSENATFNDGFNGECETHKNVKYDVNVKIKNIRTRPFPVSVSEVCFTNFTHKVSCKLKKIQQNFISKSDTAIKTGPTLKKDAFNVTLRCECSIKGTLMSNLV